MTTFTNIYKNELKSKGILSSLGSTALKRTRERLDPRNMLFGGSGMIAATGQKIFGKGYSAIQSGSGSNLATKTAEVSGLQSEAVSSLLTSSLKQESQLAIIAKNTMNNNAMARDMNVMRQNVMKLVTMGGGKASRGADMFFKDAKARENEYESKFKKGIPTTAPTQVKQEKEKSGGILGTLGMALGALGTLGTILGKALDKMSESLGSTIKSLGKTIINGIVAALSRLGILKNLPLPGKTLPIPSPSTAGKTGASGKNPKFKMAKTIAGRIAGPVAAIATVAAVVEGREEANEMQRIREKENKSRSDPTAPKLTAEEQILSNEDRKKTDEMNKQNQELIEPYDGKPSAAALAIKKFLRFGVGEGDERLKNKQTTPTPASSSSAISTSPTKVGALSENLVNFVKKKEGFSPRAFWDHKQWSIGYGTKSYDGEVIDEREADKRLREVLQKSQDAVLTHASKNNYDFNQNQVDALTSFVYNLGPSILNQLTKNGSRSIEDIENMIPEYNKASGKISGGLQKRRAEELAMFKSPPPTTGTALASASTASSDLNRASSTQQPPIVNVNAPQTTNVAGGKGGGQQVASATNIDALELFFKFAM